MRASRWSLACRSCAWVSADRCLGRLSIMRRMLADYGAPGPYGTTGFLPRSPNRPNHLWIFARTLRVTCMSTSLLPPLAQWPGRSRRKERIGGHHCSSRESGERTHGCMSAWWTEAALHAEPLERHHVSNCGRRGRLGSPQHSVARGTSGGCALELARVAPGAGGEDVARAALMDVAGLGSRTTVVRVHNGYNFAPTSPHQRTTREPSEPSDLAC